jgi:co-chaperonin GroES (HSP10)
MGNKLKNIKPCGKMVLLKFYEVKQETFDVSKSGILTFNQNTNDEKKKYYALVEAIGPDVDLSAITFKVGDRVFYNDYDLKTFGDKENTYGMLKAENVWATYEEE